MFVVRFIKITILLTFLPIVLENRDKRKYILLNTHGEERNSLVREMLDICKAERANALDTIPLVEFDSRLGYEPSMEYMCDKAHIDWKLELLEEVMEKELPAFYEK